MPNNAKYLGLPLITSRITKTDCLPLFENITSKLCSWSNTKLSQAGRLVIVQSITTAMISYWSRHYILPAKLISMVNSALARFLWHGDPFSKKLIPISFWKAQLPKNLRGLGITNIKTWNKAAISTYFDNLLSCSPDQWTQWVLNNLIRGKNFWAMQIPPNASWSWCNILKLRSTFLPLIQCNVKANPQIPF